MDISIPVTIKYPPQTLHTPFGDITNEVADVHATVVLHIEKDTAAEIKALL